jgi:hypothetical protein
MPYSKQTNHPQCSADKPIAVVKDSDGEVMGCHPDDESANKQMAALHAKEPAAKAVDFDKMKQDIKEAICEVLKSTMPMMTGEMMEEIMMPWVASFMDEYVVIELGMEDYWQVPYIYDDSGMVTISPQSDWLKVEPMKQWVEAAKARVPRYGWVKAVGTDDGEWLLDVLGAPYGGPMNGKDLDGDTFSDQTDFWLDKIGKRPVIQYHGWDSAKGGPTNPELIGEELGHQVKSDGVWFRVRLDKTKEAARQMWEAAKAGACRASSGAISHLVRPLNQHGHKDLWPIAELSLVDTRKGIIPKNAYAVALPVLKATFEAANLTLTINESEASAEPQGAESPANEEATKAKQQEITMSTPIDEVALEAYLSKREAERAEAQRIKDLEEKAKEYDALKAQISEAETNRAGTQQIKRLPHPGQEIPAAEIVVSSRWDGFTLGQLGLGYDMLKAKGIIPSTQMYRALHAKALKAASTPNFYDSQITRDEKGFIQREFSPLETEAAVKAMRAINPMELADKPAVKDNEIMYSTQNNYGDQWVPALWSPELWDLVRNGAEVLSKFRQVEVAGESLTLPTLAGKTTVYKTAQTTNQAQLAETAATATLTKATTGNVTLTPVKGTAWIEWAGEFTEDSIVPVLPSLQSALQLDLMEQIDEILISGDTDTANTNISDTGDAGIATTWHLLMANGLRDHALANSLTVDVGAIDATKFLTVKRKLGNNAINMQKCFWAFDPGIYDTALALGEALTSEKRSSNIGTFEDGLLVRIYGAPLVVSDRYGLTDTAGKIHTTPGNNVKGSFLLVRSDRFIVGFGRRITIETLPRDRVAIITDTNGLFASFRLDFKANGTQGAALGYDVTLVG